MVRELLKGHAHRGSSSLGGVGCRYRSSTKKNMSDREGKFLWSILVCLDRESAKKEQK